MKLISSLGFSLMLSLSLIAQAQDSQPNILLIIADDMGLDASTCYDLGSQQAPMPNLQALCESGIVFENAYAAPVCSPTRATIMTGKYGFRTGVGSAIARDGSNALSADELSLFDVLATTDYSANVIGKWHLAGSSDLDHPEQMGVPDFFGIFKGATKDYFKWTAVSNGEEEEIDGYTTTVFTDRAIDWIEKQDKPWFLWLAHNAPHSPFHLPPTDLHSFDVLEDSVEAVKKNPLPYYQAMLEALDTEIGRLLEAVPEDTVVMFIGDNGSPNQVTRGLFGDHGAKSTLFDSGTNVPFIVAGPNITAGRNDSFVQSVDLFSTVAALAGAAPALVSGTDSIDFSPVLARGEGLRDSVYVEHFSGEAVRGNAVLGWALRVADMKLMWVETEQEFALYDLEQDVMENKNLLADGISEDEQKTVDMIKSRYDALTAE